MHFAEQARQVFLPFILRPLNQRVQRVIIRTFRNRDSLYFVGIPMVDVVLVSSSPSFEGFVLAFADISDQWLD